jgi:O-antigen/teichoic acid export membrane protein
MAGVSDPQGSSPGIARKGARVLVFRIATAASDTLVVVVTARALGADGRGLYALASFTAAAVASMVGGTAMSLSAEYAHDRADKGRLYAGSLSVSVIGGTVVGLCLLIAALIAGPGARVLIYPAVIAPMLILSVLQIGVFQAVGDVGRLGYVTLATSVVPLIALAAAAVLAPGRVYIALAVWAAACAAVPLATLAWERRDARFDFREGRPMLRRVFRRGLPVSAANAIQLLNYRVDLLVVTAMLALAQVGRYSVAIAMGESLLILSRSLVSGAFKRIITTSPEESIRLLTVVVRHSFILLLAGGVALILVGWLFLEPVFGGQFSGVWVPLALLVPGLIALGTAEPLRLFFLIRMERAREYLIAATASMVINLVLAVVLVPPLGLSGAALSTSISYSIGGLYLFVRFSQSGGPRSPLVYVPRREDVVHYVDLVGSLLRLGGARPPRRPPAQGTAESGGSPPPLL